MLSDQSLLQIYAYRAGTLARVGHNHVIASRHLRGELRVPDEPTQTRFSIIIPVALLTIDEPDLRLAAGAEFASEVPDTARDGTRKNMLSEALLDVEHYAGIELTSKSIERTAQGYEAIVTTVVKGVASDHRVPLRIDSSAGRITARGTFALSQSALGLTPFSVMMGALAVRDEMQISFAIVAAAEG